MRSARRSDGFTLLEVLVALAILGLAVVTIIQLFSQGLRLLKLSGDQQRAVLLADQKIREAEPTTEGIETGEDDGFTWERRVVRRPVPEELTVQGFPELRILHVSVRIRWGNRSLEVATLRTALEGQPQ